MLTHRDDTWLPPGAWATALALVATAIFILIGCDGAGGAGSTASGRHAHAQPRASRRCDRVVQAPGHDGASAGKKHGAHSLQALLAGLHRGQTGCLRGGTYRTSSARQLKISRPGVTLRSFPGEHATIDGPLWVAGPEITLTRLTLDGANPRGMPSPVVSGDKAALRGNRITNHHTGICVSLGARGYKRPNRVVIANNRIHDCGRIHPVTNQDHGIYLAFANHTLIRNNVIYDNADRGIQLYPSAQRTRILGNVIDGNGEGVIFGGGAHTASSHTRIERNVITNSQLRGNVESSYAPGAAVGRDNVVRYNCISGARKGYPGLTLAGIQTPAIGFTASNNVAAGPGFVNRDHARYRLAKGSPCRGLGRAVRLEAGAANTLRGEIPGARGGQTHRLEIEARHKGHWIPAGEARVFTRRFQIPLGRLHTVAGRTLLRVALAGRPRSNAVRVAVRPGRHSRRGP